MEHAQDVHGIKKRGDNMTIELDVDDSRLARIAGRYSRYGSGNGDDIALGGIAKPHVFIMTDVIARIVR